MAKKFDNIGNGENLRKGIDTFFNSDPAKEKIKQVSIERPEEKKEINDISENNIKKTIQKKEYVVKTFGMYENEFSMIDNYVAYKRMQGEIRFTQKEAISDALNLLREVEKNKIELGPVPDQKRQDETVSNRTFNILKDDFDFIESIVKNRRMQGEIRFTQRSTLIQAFSLLKKKYPNI